MNAADAALFDEGRVSRSKAYVLVLILQLFAKIKNKAGFNFLIDWEIRGCLIAWSKDTRKKEE